MLFLSCLSFSQAITENFEGTTLPNLGTGDWALTSGTWKVFDNGIGTVQSWGVLSGANACSGRSAYLTRENVTDGTLAEDWLVTPQVTIPTNGQLRFTTKQALPANFGSIYSIRVSTTSQTDATTFQTIQTWDESQLNVVYNVCEEKVVQFPAIYVGQPVYVAFVMTNDNGDFWIVDDVSIVEECLQPTALASTPTATTANLTWTGNGTSYEIEHLVGAGATPTGIPTATSTTNSYLQTGLTSNTQYCYYVRSICTYGTTSYTSEWEGPFCYTTTLAPVGCGGNFTDPGGPTAMYSNNANVSTLICPDNSTDLVTVTFTAFNLENNWDFLRVYAGTSAAAPLIGTFTGTAIPASVTSSSPGGCLFFVFTSDGSGTRDGWIANIACAPAPTCSSPINVTTSNVVPDSATVAWTQPANPDASTASEWQVLALACGSPLPNATTTGWVNAPASPFTVTGLSPDTCYTFYVRAICSTTDSSGWSVGVNATTPVIPPACGGTFTDPGGATANYPNSANVTTLICPDNSTDLVTVTFSAFDLENNFDNLRVYAGTSAAAPLVATYTGTAIPPAISSAAPGECLFFVFTSDGSVARAGWVASVTCAPAPTCSKPVNVTATNILSTSATITWTQPANPDASMASEWQVLALPCGSPLPDATTTGWVNAPASPFALTGLTPDTCYTFYVRAVCSTTDSSTWSTGVNGNTQQVPPACGGVFTDTGGANGNYANSANITTTICPDVPGNVVIVNFASFELENNFDNLSIYDGNTVGAPLLGTFTGNNMPPQFIASLANGGCLTFRFTSDSSVTRPGWVANIICAPPPTCPQPNTLALVSNSPTEATISWNETGTSTNWNVVVQASGAGYPNATSTIIPTLGANPFTITGLTSSTQYEFYVQSDCGNGDLSFWTGPFAFNTTFAGCTGNAAAGDACAIATPICNLNGYCGNTSAAYSDTSWSQLDTAFCGSLENNSFLSFIATSASISFNVEVQNCTDNLGIQMMIFSAATCGSGPVTSLVCQGQMNPAPGASVPISANGLVIGQTYYLMIDGFAGDVCDYSITVVGGGTQTDVEITPESSTVCIGDSINLVASGGNGTFVWSPSTDLDTTTGASVTFTPSAVGVYTITVDSTDPNTACSSTDTTTITVIDPFTPTFNPIGTLCVGDTFVLPTTSIEGVTGSWSPAIDNTATTTYTFTPDLNQCATTATMEVAISSTLTPEFTAIAPLCTTDTAPILSTSSDNGIVGTWLPDTIDMTSIGVTQYVFTPNASCATTFELDVTILDTTLPTFNAIDNLVCQNSIAQVLPTVSNEGIVGVWSPDTIDTSVVGTVIYEFTPNAGQCAITPPTISVEVLATPTVSTIAGDSVCKGSTFTFPYLAEGTYYSGPLGTLDTYAEGDQVVINNTQTFYVYASTGIAPDNCFSQTTFTVTAVDLPVVTLSGGCVNNVYTINASLSSGTSATYTWTGPSGVINETGPSIIVSEDGEYTCTATTTLANSSECSSQATVFAANGTLCTIQKGISPNNDGSNDNFDLTGLNVKKLEIFNRYGKKVYSFNNYTNQWYGQADNGNELPTGTYYFVIERDSVSPESGWIYINR